MNLQLSLLAATSEEDKYIELCLREALHFHCDAKERWDERRKSGLTDVELKKAIAYEFGIEGGRFGNGIDFNHRGGKNPKFWVDSTTFEKPTLQGKKLISKTREVLKIPYSG